MTQRFCFRDSLPGDWTSSYQVPRDDFDQTLVTAARRQGVDVRLRPLTARYLARKVLLRLDRRIGIATRALLERTARAGE